MVSKKQVKRRGQTYKEMKKRALIIAILLGVIMASLCMASIHDKFC